MSTTIERYVECIAVIWCAGNFYARAKIGDTISNPYQPVPDAVREWCEQLMREHDVMPVRADEV